jgi:hypothetical protein
VIAPINRVLTGYRTQLSCPMEKPATLEKVFALAKQLSLLDKIWKKI